MASTSYATHSQTPPKFIYDVFLNFRGEDVRNTFLEHLCRQLKRKGIITFKDDEKLKKGHCLAPSLLQAIQQSKVAIIIFSKKYAESTWCLDEVAQIMECREKLDQVVIPIFFDVEPSHVCKQTESFAKHEERFNSDDGKVKVKRWKEVLTKAANIKGYDLKAEFHGNEAACIEKVVDYIFQQLCPAPSIDENLVGLRSQLDYISNLMENSCEDVKFIGIWGMGGIGKTTIANAAFANFSREFENRCFLADIRRKHSKGGMEALQYKLLTDVLKLKDESMEIHTVYEGSNMIKKRLKVLKVLMVLDDVDSDDQIEQLVGDGNWLCKGSRVIITTRDKHLFSKFGDVLVEYEVKKLNEDKGLKLFCRQAFKKESPENGFEHLSKCFVARASGLPLALKIWGSFLHGRKEKDWERTLERIRHIPNDKVIEKLRISYDGLDEGDKKIFLDIACFFRHKRRDYIEDVLESSGLNLYIGIGVQVLIERCLVFESSNGDIDMHDLIQEMGCYIASQEKPRSRVWQFEDVDDVLSGKMEPQAIKGIVFSPTNKRGPDENISRSFKALKQMTELKMLIFEESNYGMGGAIKFFSEMDYYLPSSLRWLDLPRYSFPSLPNSFHRSATLRSRDSLSYIFNPSELVGFRLRYSSLISCNMITMELDKLTYLDLSSSCYLLATPNFELMSNLKRLYLSRCMELKEIHYSVGRLEKLVLLDLSVCIDLTELPIFVQVSSLEFFKLESCRSLQNFPEIQENMPRVDELNLQEIPIREIPSSIQRLCGLTKLRLSYCQNLERLSDDLCELKSLKILEIRCCKQLKSLPENLGDLSKLQELHIFDTAIFQLPSSITRLSSLECLCWRGNEEFCEEATFKFVASVSGLCSLRKLELSYFDILLDEALPSDFRQCMISLEYLSLWGSDFVDLPESFSLFPRLQFLDIRDCKTLDELPQLPESIVELYADSRFAFNGNIAELATEYSELHSVTFCYDGHGDGVDWSGYSLDKMCIHFPSTRNTPFSVSYPIYLPEEDPYYKTSVLRSFQYRCYESNWISINLNPQWYHPSFVGFAVYFFSSEDDIPYCYQDEFEPILHCTIIAKLLHRDDRNNVLQTKCVIAIAKAKVDDESDEFCGEVCFAYIPFSSLWPESNTNMNTSVTPNDYSRFVVGFVNLNESTNWGCSLLYKRRKKPSSWDDSRPGSTTDIGPLSKLEYLNLSGKNFEHLPKDITQLCGLQYLDISGCPRLRELPEFPATIRELYATYNNILASESNIAELATKYSELHSVSFCGYDYSTYLVPGDLAETFLPITQPFLNRSTPFAVTYPASYYDLISNKNMSTCFQYPPPRDDSNKISIVLNPTWYSHSFVGFVVCFLFPERVVWKSNPSIHPFRHCELIAKLAHKDNGNEDLQTTCVIGRLYDDQFDEFMDYDQIVCFAYVPFSSLWSQSKTITNDNITPNHYFSFEATIQDLDFSTDWSCGLLYTDNELLTEQIRQKREAGSSEADSEEEDHDDGSQYIKDSTENDAVAENNNQEDDSDDGSEYTEDSSGDDAMAEHNYRERQRRISLSPDSGSSRTAAHLSLSPDSSTSAQSLEMMQWRNTISEMI